MTYKCLSIAGFDGSGGAGLQADCKTFSALGCYGMSVLTALPIQNTCGVRSCYEIPIQAIKEQLNAIFDDITPCAIKVGMLFNEQVIRVVSQFLIERADGIPLVVDPVMIAKSGHALLMPDAVAAMKSEILPLATVLTPNIPEAEALSDLSGSKKVLAARLLAISGESVFIKGGHEEGPLSEDLFIDRFGVSATFSQERILSKNTHGTGCTLSAAICAYLAKGESPLNACRLAKHYLHEAICSAKEKSVGKGNGPVNHFYGGIHANTALDSE